MMLRHAAYIFILALALFILASESVTSRASQEFERCLVASQKRAAITFVPAGLCESDGFTLSLPLEPEVAGELDGTPINSDDGMNLVTCLVSVSRRVYTVAPFTKTECEIRDTDGRANYAIIVPDYVDIRFYFERIGPEIDRTMVLCRSGSRYITTTRTSCENSGGNEAEAKQTVGDPYGWVRCKVVFAEVLTTADVCLQEGGVVLEEINR